MPQDADNAIIQIVKLTKIFRDFWHRAKVRALNELTFTVRQGEVFGLLGPNGAGKSTCIKLLLGLLFPTRGAIRIFGRLPRDIRVKTRIGFLPEETYLYPYLNARETLDFFGRLNRIPRRERQRRVDALIDMVGLAPARNRPIREYSKGMTRRIGIAQALINDPELILLDEPTTGLDPIGTREVKDLIAQLRDRGKTILLCSHLLADVQDVCDRIGVLYGGRLCAEGHVSELLARRNLTQFTVPELPPADVERVEETLRQLAGTRAIEVGHPQDRLEDFFLRVVREQRQAQPETAGAAEGAFDASLFTQQERPADVISRLTAPAEEEPEEEREAPAPPPEEPQRQVLQGLTQAPEPEEPEEAEKTPPAEEEKEADTERRRAILDRLTGSQDTDAQEDEDSTS
jgi:ABC-2 type transport system ATP-binding protein